MAPPIEPFHVSRHKPHAQVLARLYKQQPQRVEKAIAIFFDKFDKTKQGGLLTSEVKYPV